MSAPTPEFNTPDFTNPADLKRANRNLEHEHCPACDTLGTLHIDTTDTKPALACKHCGARDTLDL